MADVQWNEETFFTRIRKESLPPATQNALRNLYGLGRTEGVRTEFGAGGIDGSIKVFVPSLATTSSIFLGWTNGNLMLMFEFHSRRTQVANALAAFATDVLRWPLGLNWRSENQNVPPEVWVPHFEELVQFIESLASGEALKPAAAKGPLIRRPTAKTLPVPEEAPVAVEPSTQSGSPRVVDNQPPPAPAARAISSSGPKMTPTHPGADWSKDEVRALVEDYFSMLKKEAKGEPYSKKAHRVALLEKVPGRSEGSIEFKHQNVSAVLQEMGYPYIDGYKPAVNYQRTVLPDVVLEHLAGSPDEVKVIEAALDSVPGELPVVDVDNCFVRAPELQPPPVPDGKAQPRKPLKPVKYDYAGRDAANSKLGLAGEEWVVELERRRLTKAGRPDLAAKVEHVVATKGDGLGYDVGSFDPATGQPTYIEVKTTNQGLTSSFRISINEVERSETLGTGYRIYRVFRFSSDPKVYEVAGDIRSTFNLAPLVFDAWRA